MLSLTISTVDNVRTDSLVCGAGSGGQSGPWTAVSWESYDFHLLTWAVMGFRHLFLLLDDVADVVGVLLGLCV